MKLKTSFFNKTAFFKAVIRFAPLWGIYFIGGLLVMLTATGYDSSNPVAQAYFNASDVVQTIGVFAPINLVYACLAAQLLFGDLFSSRLCNALHALPLRRETWFCTHALAGVAFSFAPNLLGIAVIMLRMGQFWFVGLIWLLGMTLHYLFFFGLAVLSMFCTGNRFAMVAVYGILNFASLIAWWFCSVVFQPMLYGIVFLEEVFVRFCPVGQLIAQPSEYVLLGRQDGAGLNTRDYFFNGFGEGWGYLTVIALVGVALLAVSLLLYRRRKLESAGDFIALRPLAPVFSVVFSLCAGAVFTMFGEAIDNFFLPYLLLGAAVGFFVGQMLLRRKVKVFDKKTLLKAGLLLAAVFAALTMVRLDPIGITRWVPREQSVASVTVSSRESLQSGYYFTAKEPEDIATLVRLHKTLIQTGEEKEHGDKNTTVYLTYRLSNGSVVRRMYSAYVGEDTITTLRRVFSRPEVVLGYDDWENHLQYLQIEGNRLKWEQALSLLQAMEKDCMAGTMSQNYGHHATGTGVKVYVETRWRNSSGEYENRDIRVFSDAENTMAWLRQNAHIWYDEKDYGGMTVEDFLAGA